jgi:RHS repeat-associated protein
VGNKLTQTDAKGRTTIWTYDYFGRVLSRTLPEGMSESFHYDDANRTVNHTDFNGKATTSITNAMGRTDSISYHDGKVETFTYWASGQVKNATMNETGKDDVVTSYSYDNRDRLNIETQPDGTVLTYHYDEAGNRDQVSVTRTTVSGDQTTITDYRYDDLNRLETVIDSSGTTTYTYDYVGNQKTVVYPNGLATTYIYNDVNQLKNLTTKNANGEVLSSYSYELENTGRREAITEQDGRYTDYRYDNLYRLTDEIIKQGIDAAAVDYMANYQYDWVGNRSYETVGGVQTAYSYDLNDRLTSQGGTSYTHDDNGNTLTETLDATVKTYAYDAKDKLIGVSTTESDIEVSSSAYSYNVSGIRDSKTEDGVTTSYVVDSNRDYAQVLEEIVDGLSTVTYSYGHDLLSQSRSDEFKFYQYDGLGSTRGLSNSAGDVTDSYDYEAFGEVLNETGTTDNNYKFTGEQFDASLDQYYLRARYYDQGVGRFTQQDTYMGNSSDPVSLHKYLYANAAPSMYTDPTGNFSIISSMRTFDLMGKLSTLAYHSAGGGLVASLSLLSSDSAQVDDIVTPTDVIVAKVKSKTCVQGGNDKCKLGIPTIYFGSEMSEASNHYYDAQTVYGAPSVLSRKSPGWGRSWYTRLSISECLGRGPSQQCDEYPFNSTNEGGPNNNVSLRLINGIHNGAAGILLNSMYSKCKVSAGGGSEKHFAVIPVPSGKSGFTCAGG